MRQCMKFMFFCAVCILNLAVHGHSSGARAQGAAAILLPGAGGAVPIDFLIRNQNAFASAGIETHVATSPQQAVSIAQDLQKRGRKSVLVGMSRGGLMTASALASGAPVAGAVFVSAEFNSVRARLASPARLPASLVVHHRRDGCAMTSPAGVPGFIAWSGGKARVSWFDNQGPEVPNPCGPRGAHGFYQQDGPPVAAIISFVRSR